MYLYNCLSIADRGITGSSSIYQSVYIYDLRTKRYERKVPGVYIIPSQAHEFKLLNDELLMGLSENRNQIYIWNLNTGTYLHVESVHIQSEIFWSYPFRKPAIFSLRFLFRKIKKFFI
mgnify:FL=1